MMPMNDSLGESIRVAFERMPASSSSSWDGLMKTRCRAEGGRPRVGALRGAGSSSLSLLIRLCAGGAVRVAAASERCGGVGGGRGCGGSECLAGTDVESSLGAVRPGQDASEHQGFMPGFLPSQPPHSRQMDSSLEISEVAFPCIIVLRRRTALSRGWRPNSKSWLRTHARRIDRSQSPPTHTQDLAKKTCVAVSGTGTPCIITATDAERPQESKSAPHAHKSRYVQCRTNLLYLAIFIKQCDLSQSKGD